MARPAKISLDDEGVVEELCTRIICGRGIAEVCADKDMPPERTVYDRMAKDEAFCSRIARAREMQQEGEADKIVSMSDAATVENWQVVKLRIWSRQWRASKLAPKRYGDKQQHEHSVAVPEELAAWLNNRS